MGTAKRLHELHRNTAKARPAQATVYVKERSEVKLEAVSCSSFGYRVHISTNQNKA